MDKGKYIVKNIDDVKQFQRGDKFDLEARQSFNNMVDQNMDDCKYIGIISKLFRKSGYCKITGLNRNIWFHQNDIQFNSEDEAKRLTVGTKFKCNIINQRNDLKAVNITSFPQTLASNNYHSKTINSDINNKSIYSVHEELRPNGNSKDNKMDQSYIQEINSHENNNSNNENGNRRSTSENNWNRNNNRLIKPLHFIQKRFIPPTISPKKPLLITSLKKAIKTKIVTTSII